VSAAGDWPLPPRAARVFYNAAEAWLPAEAAGSDLVAALAPLLRAPAERVRLARALAWLEWSPRLLLRSRRGLSWLPRDERRAWLARLERGGPFRAAAARVHAAVDGAWAVAQGGAAPRASAAGAARLQSFEGA
jgi:hypothetical protein